MNISNYILKNCKAEKKEVLSLTGFLNYAKDQGYFVQPENIQHWLNEYQEYIKQYETNR